MSNNPYSLVFVKESLQPISHMSQMSEILDTLQYCIDEVIPTYYMKVFASAFQIFVRRDLLLYLVMTGLYENVDDLPNEKYIAFL